VRIVASAGLNLPASGPLYNDTAGGPVWLLHGPDAPAEARALWQDRATLIEVPVTEAGLDMAAALRQLGQMGLTRVFCEGGGALAASLLRADVVDRVVGFTAGLALGADARPNLGGLGVQHLALAPRFDLESVRRVGSDVLHVWRSAKT